MNTWTAKAHELRAAQAHILATILLEIDPSQLEPQHRYIATAAGDQRKLRGIPAIGRSVTGAIPGTTPHAIRD